MSVRGNKSRSTTVYNCQAGLKVISVDLLRSCGDWPLPDLVTIRISNFLRRSGFEFFFFFTITSLFVIVQRLGYCYYVIEVCIFISNEDCNEFNNTRDKNNCIKRAPFKKFPLYFSEFVLFTLMIGGT